MDGVTARLQDVAVGLEDLRVLLDGEEQLTSLLDGLADMAVRAIPRAAAASVTMLRDEGLIAWTAAATDEAAVAIDTDQYSSGEGPCLEAARERHAVRSGVEEIRERWPVFADSADKAGMRSYLSVPLLLDDELGALNFYGRTADAFDLFDEALVMLFTAAVSAAVVNVRRCVRARERTEELAVALTSRAEIDQAKGVLMAQHAISAEQAFEMLVLRSQRSNTKLREVARALLRSATGSPGLD